MLKKKVIEMVKRAKKKLFNELKELFTAELILKIYTLNLLTVIKINVLEFILGVYLV